MTLSIPLSFHGSMLPSFRHLQARQTPASSSRVLTTRADMFVCRGNMLPWSMSLIIQILPVVCFLGLLLSLILHLLTSSGRPKTEPQRRKLRRRLARLHKKPSCCAEKLASRVSPIERRIEDKASLSPYWTTVLVSFVGGARPRDQPKLVGMIHPLS